MKVGVPKEIKILEYRVGMVPAGVRELVHDGHEVVVETNAGAGIGMTDADYEAAGAKVVSTAKEVFDALHVKDVWMAWTENTDDEQAQDLRHTRHRASGMLMRAADHLGQEENDGGQGGNGHLRPMLRRAAGDEIDGDDDGVGRVLPADEGGKANAGTDDGPGLPMIFFAQARPGAEQQGDGEEGAGVGVGKLAVGIVEGG